MGDDYISPEQYDQYVAAIQKSVDESAGFERLKLQATLDDAKAARNNAYKIAQLQAETSRYGVDATRKTAIESMKENARQFDAEHGLNMQKFGLEQQRFGLEQQQFGLDYAKAATSYMSSPDMVWALNDFNQGVTQAGLRQAPTSVASQYRAGQGPTPKTGEDFAVLAGYAPAGAGSTGAGALTAAGGSVQAQGGGTGSQTDPRIKAMRAVADAIPPSPEAGHDDQNWAALRAIESLYFAGTPGTVERLDKTQRATAQSGLARLGYTPEQVEQQRRRALPWQGSVRMA
jgi:hypothetical protein